MEALKRNEYYNYSDYLNWETEQRYELIDGVPYLMSPAPSWTHQNISIELSRQFANFLLDKACKVFTAPFDVRLNADENDDTVVQPDLVIVCDRSKLVKTGYMGVPKMVIEILSPSTARHDKLLKFNKYLEAGVSEYWIVDPESKTLSVYLLKSGEYFSRVYSETDVVPVTALEGCAINMQSVFSDIPQEPVQ